MPAATTQPPPQPKGVTIIEGPPPKPPVTPPGEIHLRAIDQGPALEPPKPGSAREQVFSEMRKRAEKATTPPPEPSRTQKADAPVKPAPKEERPGAPAPEETPPETPPESPPPEGEKASATEPEKSGKPSLWRLLDKYKGRTVDLEKQLAEAKATSLPEQEKTGYLSRIEELEKRNQRLETEMRYINYQESDEFKAKYDKPYYDSWERATAELSEITVQEHKTDESGEWVAVGEPRPATPQDLLALVSLPLGQARQLAKAMFGDSADDMMAYRKEIRLLWKSRQQAVDEAKKNGDAWHKQRQEMAQKYQREAGEFISKAWESANASAAKDQRYSRFYTPADGDEEGNQRLGKGFELVDRAYSENPLAPNLTNEQRASIVKRHVAVRNRAAAFGKLVLAIERLEAEKAELTKEVQGYKGTTPPSSPSAPQGGKGGENRSVREQIMDDLHRRAR